jgi:fatty acid desaturase
MAISLELPRPPSSHKIVDLRQGVARYRYRRGITAFALLLYAILSYVACFVAAVVLEPVWARIVAALALGPLSALLFRIAHDAGHGCHFRSRRLNRLTGYIAILPSYHPYRV